ncbi:hypothetical protein [Coralloluteibacterium stylophorae]|uniref:Uncharacterized protein n=1 Tax=Coralloluteibacterium stylophorae TaxID=1776034 RepID=A0A8J7VV39_9GAMM|nr:hypothetical protein [Coralloluteibacterium stylophorae]MBS7458762.1 hypothetical protein [Coralloluteibacterium stylophorae]
MSITDPRLDRASLDPYAGSLGLDALQRRDEAALQQVAELDALRGTAAPAAPARDAGEDALMAPAWDAGQPRTFAAQAGFAAELAALPLTDAADRAVDAIVRALA